MEDILTNWTNVALVPVVAIFVAVIKNIFDLKGKSLRLAPFIISIVACHLNWFLNTPEPEIQALFAGSVIGIVKEAINLLVTAAATGFSAMKGYDILIGDKKHDKEIQDHVEEKEELKGMYDRILKELEEAKTVGNVNEQSEKPPTDDQVSNKIKEILGEQ